MVDPHDSMLSVKQHCELLGLPRSSYYYAAIKTNVETEKVMQLVDERGLRVFAKLCQRFKAQYLIC